MKKRLMQGNEAVVAGAILGGATHFFGYPITPASEITHSAAALFPQAGRHFLQAESEGAAINMIYGASCAGARVMTASSGPGVSLMTECISYIASAELPCVIIDVQRAGPGLGNIWPEQSDYHLAVKGAGHGDFRSIVLAPYSAQEMCDFTYRAFDLADEWRMSVIILSDAYVGQMMEPVELPQTLRRGMSKPWAVRGTAESRGNLFTTILMNPDIQAAHNAQLQEKYARIEREFFEYEESLTDDAELVFVAYGISARVCVTAVQRMRAEGRKVGLFRPKTLFPLPSERIRELSKKVRRLAVVELCSGQMADDIERLSAGRAPVARLNWLGGQVPSARELTERVMSEGLLA